MEIDFAALAGREIFADYYYYALTKKGWKYDLEESDLFYMLTRTFWKENIKVCLVFEEHCCLPPMKEEEVRIDELCFFAFDPNVYKPRSIESSFEKEHKHNPQSEFESLEAYKAYFNEQYPHYILYADFNTSFYWREDFDALQKIELSSVPEAIQKEIWADLSKL